MLNAIDLLFLEKPKLFFPPNLGQISALKSRSTRNIKSFGPKKMAAQWENFGEDSLLFCSNCMTLINVCIIRSKETILDTIRLVSDNLSWLQ